jgi:hypothetical protein
MSLACSEKYSARSMPVLMSVAVDVQCYSASPSPHRIQDRARHLADTSEADL